MDKNKFINKNSILLTIVIIVLIIIPKFIIGIFNINLINIVIITMFVLLIAITILFMSRSIYLLKKNDNEPLPNTFINFLLYIIKIYNKSMKKISGSDNFIGIPTEEKSQVLFFGIIILFFPIILITLLVLFSVYSKKKNTKQVHISSGTKLKTYYDINFSNLQNIILVIISIIILYCFFNNLLTSLVNNITLSRLNNNFSNYNNIFLIIFLIYISLYCYFIDYQQNKTIVEIEKKI